MTHMITINDKSYDVRIGDVFIAKRTGLRMYVDHVSRGDVYYHTDEHRDSTMVTVEKLFTFCTKE